jgi:L-alanine-DL-glutamate epimerase-like enolase superfamily enzyme
MRMARWGSRMSIQRVQAFPVRYPEPNNDGKVRSICLVRVEADDGAVGWGEAITGAQEVSLATAFLVERRLAPIVVGRRVADANDVRAAWQAMRDATYWDGNGGIVTFGISAIDMALWDLAGRIAGVPVHALLSDRTPTSLPACASTILATGDLDRVAQEFAGFVAQGFPMVKGGWGHDLSIAFGRDETRDLAVGRAVRAAVGPDTPVILDVVALAGWDADHAIRMCRALEDQVGLYWFEDALPEQDVAGYRALRAAATTRICTGEKGWHEAHFRTLIDAGAIDVVMLDPAKAEGITGSWRVIAAAAAAGMSWNAHAWSSALDTAASLHLAAATDNTLLMELKPLPSPMQDELVTNPIHQVGGRVHVPTGAGLGVEVDAAVVRAYGFTEDDLGR